MRKQALLPVATCFYWHTSDLQILHIYTGDKIWDDREIVLVLNLDAQNHKIPWSEELIWIFVNNEYKADVNMYQLMYMFIIILFEKQ